jgi:hypothetical protein
MEFDWQSTGSSTENRNWVVEFPPSPRASAAELPPLTSSDEDALSDEEGQPESSNELRRPPEPAEPERQREEARGSKRPPERTSSVEDGRPKSSRKSNQDSTPSGITDQTKLGTGILMLMAAAEQVRGIERSEDGIGWNQSSDHMASDESNADAAKNYVWFKKAVDLLGQKNSLGPDPGAGWESILGNRGPWTRHTLCVRGKEEIKQKQGSIGWRIKRARYQHYVVDSDTAVKCEEYVEGLMNEKGFETATTRHERLMTKVMREATEEPEAECAEAETPTLALPEGLPVQSDSGWVGLPASPEEAAAPIAIVAPEPEPDSDEVKERLTELTQQQGWTMEHLQVVSEMLVSTAALAAALKAVSASREGFVTKSFGSERAVSSPRFWVCVAATAGLCVGLSGWYRSFTAGQQTDGDSDKKETLER